MRKIDLSPEAYDDLEGIKEHLITEFGELTEKKILKSIIKDMKRLEKYPEIGSYVAYIFRIDLI